MSKNKIQTLKGFRDFLPEDAIKREWLIGKLKEIFELWGYDPVETPILEPLEIFEGQIGEDEKLFYKFDDPGGRKVALRYDQSVPISRVIGQYNQQLPMPFRRYQIQPTFRAEKPQKGRYREFIMCDADIFGVESSQADAEVIALLLDIYKRLGFKNIKVYVNDRKLLKGIPYEAIVAIDKLKKIGTEGVIEDMIKKGIEKNKAREYLNKIKSLKPNQTINDIFNYLEKLNYPKDWYEFDPTIARSFSYSDGPIWEIVSPDYKAGSLSGGERFDGLIEEVSGIKVPATGFGLGLDRTLEAAESLNLIPVKKTVTKVLVTIFAENTVDSSIKIVKVLRSAKINTELYPEIVPLAKQLKYADKKGIPYAVIIGPDEILKNEVIVKNLLNKRQETIPIDALLTQLR
ncbi:histidine--tRNA ligase [Candidatus Woesebacteria bacterium]|nr:MAG: histidine--tRNA ligase [Candidatus Woesebacteria bacterium]